MPPLNLEAIPSLRYAAWLRTLLGYRVLNGLSVGPGLAVMSVLVYLAAGPAVAVSALLGMLIVSIGDQVAPARGKLRQLAPLLWMAAPMSAAVQFAHLVPDHSTALIGAVVCVCGFIAMLGTAWGARGAPLSFALVLTIVFAMSTSPTDWRAALVRVAWFQVGAFLYAAWAVFSAWILNLRFRTQALAEAIDELAVMLRQQGKRLAATGDRRENELRALLGEQATLADKLQAARDLVLDLPASERELRLAGMLIAAIRLREQALACELELDMQPARGCAPPAPAQVQALESLWGEFSADLDRVGWSLLGGGELPARLAESLQARTADAQRAVPPAVRGAVDAMCAEIGSLLRLAERGGDEPRLALAEQARDWPRFRTSMRWPIAPLKRAMHGQSPVLRYALRVSIALLVGYIIGLHLPWATHPQWILLSIAVVMRTNLAQTLERRNARLLGTLIGCVLVTALLSLNPSVPVQFLVLALGAGIAHGFVQVRYLVAATAATVLALIQGHLLHTAGEFALFERLADTLIGTALAWVFSYVLPAWERRQLPALLKRLRNAQLQHAQVALGSAELSTANADWRLARREVHDSLAAIALAAQRARSEPRAVQPPLDLLEKVQLRSYRLLAQLGGLRTWREQPRALPATEAAPLLAAHLARITAALAASSAATGTDAPIEARTETISGFEELAQLHRRLDDAADEARALGADLAAAQAWEAARLQEK
ncbi:MAG TPA: FUSC family protein [Burkholderiaceae bacterium]|nr:FUSC family protein [Burkholderiaceae bacterium]